MKRGHLGVLLALVLPAISVYAQGTRGWARGGVVEEAVGTAQPCPAGTPATGERRIVRVLADEGDSRTVGFSMAAITGFTEEAMDAAIITGTDTGMDMAD